MTVSDAPLEERLAERITDAYNDKQRDPIAVARMMRDLANLTSRQRAIYLTGIPESSFHNCLGLLRLPDRLKQLVSAGEITFKVARALSRLEQAHAKTVYSYINRVQMKGEVAEKFITMAAKHPELRPADVSDLMVLPPKPAVDAPLAEKFVPPAPRPGPEQLEPRELLKIAGQVEMLQPQNDIERLPLLSALRVLQGRVGNKIGEMA